MKKTMTALLGAAALSIAGCSGEAETSEAEGSEVEAGEEAEGEEEAEEHGGYITDETGELTAEIGEASITNINERLATTHQETGRDIHVLIVGSTNGEDSDAAAADALSGMTADALIYIATRDQEIAVVGENIDKQEGEGAARAIVMAFDNGNFENGLLNGIMATSMHMED